MSRIRSRADLQNDLGHTVAVALMAKSGASA
jgi:hypothetical protein